MVGMFVSLCLASQKPSEWEFLFLPERTYLGVKLMLRKGLTILCHTNEFVQSRFLDGVLISYCTINKMTTDGGSGAVDGRHSDDCKRDIGPGLKSPPVSQKWCLYEFIDRIRISRQILSLWVICVFSDIV